MSVSLWGITATASTLLKASYNNELSYEHSDQKGLCQIIRFDTAPWQPYTEASGVLSEAIPFT